MDEFLRYYDSLKREYVSGFAERGGPRKVGPEIEGILFDPEVPFDVPCMDKVSGMFETLVARFANAVPVNETLVVNGVPTEERLTGARMVIDDYEVYFTTDMSRCTFEVTLPPSASLQRNMDNMEEVLGILGYCAGAQGLELLGLGVHPFAKRSLLNMVPKPRYALMSTRFHEEELLGLTISAAAQFHVDVYRSDAARILNVLNGFVPMVIAATGNSTVVEGRLSPYKEYRGAMWDMHAGRGSIEEDRVGIPRRFCSIGDYFGYLASHAPIISRRRFDGRDVTVLFEKDQGSLSSMLRSGSATVRRIDSGELRGIVPGMEEVAPLEGTVWTDVRLRRGFGTVEFRPCAFQPSVREIMSIAALVKGLAENSVEGERFLSSHTVQEIKEARRDAIGRGLEAEIGGGPVAVAAERMMEIAERGLDGKESGFLLPMRRNVEERRNPADRTRIFVNAELSGMERPDKKTIDRFVERHRFRA